MLDMKKIKDKIPKDPKKFLLNMLIIFLFGVLLIIIGDISGSFSSKNVEEKGNSVEVNSSLSVENDIDIGKVQTDTYEEKVKKELIETLSNIDGVGNISVMINFESGEQSVPAFNEVDSNKRVEEKDSGGGLRVTTENSKNQEIVMITNGNENKPLVVKQYNPKISGVVIVAEGSEDPIVKERLFYAVKTVLNLPGSKVSIMPMKKSK